MIVSETWALWIAGLMATAVLGWIGRLHFRLDDLGKRTTQIETKVELFWRGIGEKMASMLHSPHTPVLDQLLERWKAGTLKNGDLQELTARLRRIEQGESDEHHPDAISRIQASLLLLAIEHAT